MSHRLRQPPLVVLCWKKSSWAIFDEHMCWLEWIKSLVGPKLGNVRTLSASRAVAKLVMSYFNSSKILFIRSTVLLISLCSQFFNERQKTDLGIEVNTISFFSSALLLNLLYRGPSRTRGGPCDSFLSCVQRDGFTFLSFWVSNEQNTNTTKHKVWGTKVHRFSLHHCLLINWETHWFPCKCLHHQKSGWNFRLKCWKPNKSLLI